MKSHHSGNAAFFANKVKELVRSNDFLEALTTTAVMSNWTPEFQFDTFPEGINPESILGRAMAPFVDPTIQPPAGENPPPDFALYESIVTNAPEKTQGILSQLRGQATQESDRWALAVAEGAILIEHLNRPHEALALLRGEADQLYRAPLPWLIRAHDRGHESLAALALEEAQEWDDDQYKQWRYAWAAYHMESIETGRARELYQQALEYDPKSSFCIAGLERTESNREAIAETCKNAAAAASNDEERKVNLIRAGIQLMLNLDFLRAAETLGQALEISPDDRPLRRLLLRLALANKDYQMPPRAMPRVDDPGLDEYDLYALATISLHSDPVAALGWFEEIMAHRPDDSIADLGYREALAKSGRDSELSSNLLSKLRDAQSPLEEAPIFQRLASIDRRNEEEQSSAVLSLISFDDKLPGHRPTLVRLLSHFLSQHRSNVLPRVLSGLARTLVDRTAAQAFASAAWQMEPSQLELLEIACNSETASVLELSQMEGLLEDPAAKIPILERICAQLDENSFFASKLAEALTQTGEYRRSGEIFEHILELDKNRLLERFYVAHNYRLAQNHHGLIEALEGIKKKTIVPQHKVDALNEAAEVAREHLGDIPKSIQYALDILAIHPQNENAYRTGRELLGSHDGLQDENELWEFGDPHLLAKLIQARLPGVQDSDERRKLHYELARVLLESENKEDREKAKEQILKGLEIHKDDLDIQRWLARLYMEDEQWEESIKTYMHAARLVVDPYDGVEIFYALGTLYLNHSDRLDLAEKSFLKVLGWDRAHFAAMEHLSNMYFKAGNMKRAKQALEHLINLAGDKSVKVVKMILLAQILEGDRNRPKQAEKTLREAWSVDRYNFRPIDALAQLYKNQGDNLAYNIHLDRALASHAEALTEIPDNQQIYENIKRISQLQESDTFAALAEEAMELAQGSSDGDTDSRQPLTWEVGARLAEQTFDVYLCPKSVPAGFRETIRLLEEPIAKMSGMTAKQIGLGRDAKLNRKHPLASMLSEMAPKFGLNVPQGYISNDTFQRIVPSSSAAILFPEFIANSADPRIHQFCVVYSLQMIRMGLSISTLFPPDPLRTLLAAAIRYSIPNFVPKGIKESDVAAAESKLREAVPSKIHEQIRPFAFDCSNALNEPNMAANILSVGVRSGFMGAGSLTGAINGLRGITGVMSGSLKELPGAGQLMSFVFSKDHIELRRRLGI